MKKSQVGVWIQEVLKEAEGEGGWGVDMKEGWRRRGGSGVDAALLTLFVKIIKHFFSSSEFLFVFSGDAEVHDAELHQICDFSFPSSFEVCF